MAKKSKNDQLAKKVEQTQKQVDHLIEELGVLQAKIDDSDDTTPDAELEAAIAEAHGKFGRTECQVRQINGEYPSTD